MTALPSIHALRAIHEPTAQFIINTGRFEKSNRPIYFLEWVWYNENTNINLKEASYRE